MSTFIDADSLASALSFAYENFALVVVDQQGVVFIAPSTSTPE